MADHNAYHDIEAKITKQREMIQGFQAMRNSSDNPMVQSQIDVQLRVLQTGINHLQNQMNNLSLQGQGSNDHGPGSRHSGGYSSGSPYSPDYIGQGGARADYGPGGYSDPNNPATGPPRAPYDPSGPEGSTALRQRPNYSRLDLLKDNTPHLGPRIQLMLSQLQFKLNVEKQYRDGIQKIIGVYRGDGDAKVKAEAQVEFHDSQQKIQLLSRALKQYEDLHVDVDSQADALDDDSVNVPTLRRPLTGLLTIRIQAVSDVSHAVTSRLSRGPETFITIKVEKEEPIRTKGVRNDRWADEYHSIAIDKANEIELTVYDRTGSNPPRPVGMFWVRVSDIGEEMRRKKIETEINNSGWMSADRAMQEGQIRPDTQFNPQSGNSQKHGQGNAMQPAFGGGPQPSHGPVIIDDWFSLEPVGRIHLAMSFEKQKRERRPFEGVPVRRGAVRARKEEVVERYGHKFVPQTFYNIMRCALCGELLKYATGMQCSDCRFMCHKECYDQVVTKCISKSNTESDQDEYKLLKFRIPHRFEPWSNIGASWCCHCGMLLPLGKKNCRKCRECKLTAHAGCTHLVPDFCGMPMNRANDILKQIEQTERAATGSGRKPPAKTKPQRLTPSVPSDASHPGLGKRPSSYENDAPSIFSEQGSQMSMGESSQTSMASSSMDAGKYQYGGQPTPQQNLPSPSMSPGTAPGSSGGRPQATRSDTSHSLQAAAAATAALQGKSGRGPEPTPSNYPPPRSSGPSYPPQQQQYQQPPPAKSQPAPPTHAPYNPRDYEQYDRQTAKPPPSPYNRTPVTSPPPPQQMSQPPPASVPSSPPQKTAPPPQQQQQQPPPQQPQKAVQKQRRPGLDDFNFLSVLGKGNFGKVMLAEHKRKKELYAIKVLKKEFIIENDEVESTKSERDVLIIANKARHPFLLSLHACFQTETRVYFVMEYISGGDLMLHIQRGQFGLRRAQFYAAEVCLALKYFHDNGVVYRDLKLDNIMLNLDGHIKIADYGLCKKDMWYGSTTSTFCGTPEFMAPEILLDKKYGRAVDWWAFGVLIYQMLLQQSPFRGEDEEEIYDAILADEPLYPIHMPRESVSILQKLLTREPEARLGSGQSDAEEIMAHPFFKSVNWADFLAKKVQPPFVPSVRNPTDTSNFDTEFTSVTPVLTPVQSVLSQAMQEEFRGFSYTADFDEPPGK